MPSVAPSLPVESQDEGCADYYDVVIVGAGPAGLMLGACLSRWGYHIKLIDNRPHPSTAGRADGFQPLTLSILQRMELLNKIRSHQPPELDQVAFWNPDSECINGHITKTASAPSFPSEIGARYPFSATLHQGYIENILIEHIQENGADVQRPWTIDNFTADNQNAQYPLTVHLSPVNGGEGESVKTKYLFSGEGARSFVRHKLDIPMEYKEPAQFFWGVVDGIVETDFPDIRTMCAIRSTRGSILVIPRECGMVRLYMQLPKRLHPPASIAQNDRHLWDVKLQQIQDQICQALQPYSIKWTTVDWWSVYPIRQGISESYTLDHRVFLGGDACHVHSPKAGQGMNMAIMDSLNLAWKIHFVERGFAHRNLLKTYQDERKRAAHEVIDFDNHYARVFSVVPAATDSTPQGTKADSNGHGSVTLGDQCLRDAFAESNELISGYGIRYQSNMVNWSPSPTVSDISSLFNPTWLKLCPGRQFMPLDAIRVSDSMRVCLEETMPLNGSYQVMILAGNPVHTAPALQDFGLALKEEKNSLSRLGLSRTPKKIMGEILNPPAFSASIVFAADSTPGDFVPSFDDLFPYCQDRIYVQVRRGEASVQNHIAVDDHRGAVVVIRPDGFVGCTIELEEGSGTINALVQYFKYLQVQQTDLENPDYPPPQEH